MFHESYIHSSLEEASGVLLENDFELLKLNRLFENVINTEASNVLSKVDCVEGS
jgi:hypothetical protein